MGVMKPSLANRQELLYVHRKYSAAFPIVPTRVGIETLPGVRCCAPLNRHDACGVNHWVMNLQLAAFFDYIYLLAP